MSERRWTYGTVNNDGIIHATEMPLLTDADVLAVLGGERLWWCEHSRYEPLTPCNSYGDDWHEHDECGYRWLVKETP